MDLNKKTVTVKLTRAEAMLIVIAAQNFFGNRSIKSKETIQPHRETTHKGLQKITDAVALSFKDKK